MSLDGFSNRLNYVLDEMNFIQGRGRLIKFSELIDHRNTRARNWLMNNMYPRGDTMARVLDVFYEKELLSSSINKGSLLLWLEKGDKFCQNPFKSNHPSEVRNLEICRAKVYFSVYQESILMGINLIQIPNKELDQFFEQIFSSMNTLGITSLNTSDIQMYLQQFITLPA